MTIKERLTAIADALETASKQARLLADEIDNGCTVEIDVGQIAKATQRLNRRAGTQATNDNLQSYPKKDDTMLTKDDQSRH